MAGKPMKSNINILQEYSISKYRVNPLYIIKDVSPSIQNPRFEVTIELDRISCSAQSTSKKQAKEMCARLLIDKLGLAIQTPPKAEVDKIDATENANYNAVGYLNEYASKNSIPYAEYNDAGSNEKGHMIIECKLGEFYALGLGVNKKIARQHAAWNLLKKLKGSNTPKKLEFPTPETTTDATITFIKSEETASKEVEVEIAEVKSETHENTPETTENTPKTPENTPKIHEDTPETPEEEKTREGTPKTPENTPETPEEEKTHVGTPETPEETQTVEELCEIREAESGKPMENTCRVLEEEMLVDFRLKLFNLGLKDDDNNLEVFTRCNSYVLKYKNEQINLNVVKINYNLKLGLDNIYKSIKERVES